MTHEQQERVERAVDVLMGLDASSRLHEIDRLCGGDAAVTEEVQRRLQRLVEAESFFQRFEPARRVGPLRVGPYRILGELGRGGMGSVYRATRDDGEFSREVAVKFVSVLVVDDEIRKRFGREKRILGALQHPNIAQLLDAGTTEDGIPFTVMELVEGVPIDRWCCDRALPVTARIVLFRQVCEAVAFIHGHLIVHGDIKPSNILVTREGAAKLLDFGISRMLSRSGDADDTELQRRMMTLNYASPEQVNGIAVTVGSDIYSLGLVLYELVTGQRAYNLDQKSLDEVVDVVCRREIPNPKTGSTDLDAILLKALSKDRAARYPCVADFSADLTRFLTGYPVLAQSPSSLYLARKFVHRNKPLTALAAGLLLAVFTGLLGFAWQARVAERERAIAQMRFDQVRSLARSMLNELHDKIAGVSGSVEARRLLVSQAVQYLGALSQQASGDPGLRLELAAGYRRLGEIQGSGDFALGDWTAAIQSLQKARGLLQPAVSQREAARELAHTYIAESHLHNYRRDAKGMRVSAEEAVRIAQDLNRQYPSGVEERYLLARALRTASFLRQERLKSYEEIATILHVLKAERPNDLRFQDLLNQIDHDIGSYLVTNEFRYEEALPYLFRAHQANSALTRANPSDRQVKMNLSANCYLLAICLFSKDSPQLPEAERYALEAVEIRRQLSFQDQHDSRLRERLAAAEVVAGNTQAASGKLSEAVTHYRHALHIADSLESTQRNLPGLVATRGHSTLGIARWEEQQGNRAAACAGYRKAHDDFKRLVSPRRFEQQQYEEARIRAAGCP